MPFFSRRKQIIKKAVSKTVKAFSDRKPKIYNHLFYGMFDSNPRNLVVWYLFENNNELEAAKLSGLCAELEELTVNNLILLGYPKDSFDGTKTDDSEFNRDIIKTNIASEDDVQRILNGFSDTKVKISFTTQEDIDKKTNGDYRLYFQ